MATRLPDFDDLVHMARNRPDALELLRQELVAEIIGGASTEQQRRRLEGLQFKVDMERRRAASPLAATIKLSEMMCQSLADLHRSLITPLDTGVEPVEEVVAVDGKGPVAAPAAGSATILPFDRRRSDSGDPDLI
ncbi:MAG: DUF3135 domain-containing protein [Pseudomonadota bacterium]